MFKLFFGRSPLNRRGGRPQYGRLFTPVFTISAIVLLIIVLAAVFAPLAAPYDPYLTDLPLKLAKPSSEHLLGCDANGRDVLSRLIFGGRTALLGALGVVALSVVLGVPLGLFCGYAGGRADTLIMRACDILLSFPSLLLAFVFVAGFGPGLKNAILALGIVYVPMLTRLTRSLSMVERNKIYVTACASLGYGGFRIMYRHILPNCLSTILVQLTLDVAYAILDLAALSFLGLGVGEPTADWGAMLNAGRDHLLGSPHLAIVPGIMIVLVVVSLNLFSDGLHQYLDPAQTELPSFKRYDKRRKREERRGAA